VSGQRVPSHRAISITHCALAVFLGALGIRVAYIFLSRDLPAFVPALDIVQAWEAARDLRSGVRPSFALAVSTAPGYPTWLALWQTLLGEALLPHRVVAALVGSLRCALIVVGAGRLGVRLWAAAAAGLAMAFLPASIVFDTTLLKVGLGSTLFTAALVIVLGPAADTRPRQLGRGVAIGLLLGAMVLVQLLDGVVGVVLLAALIIGRERRLATIVAAGTLLLVPILGVRLWHLKAGPTDPFLPRAGFELALGQQPLSHPCPDPAGFCAAGNIPATPDGHAFAARLGMSVQVGRMLSPANADRIWRAEALRRIEGDPGKAAWLASIKLRAALNDFERKDNDHIPWLQVRVPALGFIPLGFGWLVVAGLTGLVGLVWQRDRRAWLFAALVVACTSACLLGVVTSRTRFPLTVPLTLLGAIALDLATRDPRRQMVLLTAAAMAALLAFWPVPKAIRDDHFARGVRNERAAATPLSADPIERALQLDLLSRHREADALAAAAETRDARAAGLRLKYALWESDLEKARALYERLPDDLRASLSRFMDPPTMAALRKFVAR
jgi:hypothetical protein